MVKSKCLTITELIHLLLNNNFKAILEKVKDKGKILYIYKNNIVKNVINPM